MMNKQMSLGNKIALVTAAGSGIGREIAQPWKLDIDQALDAATELFWSKGYDDTSLSDLTTAIGITLPSFHFAFGSKEALFRLVCERYRANRLAFIAEALEAPSAREVAERMLYGWADAVTSPGHPCGSMAVRNAGPGSVGTDPIRDDLDKDRQLAWEALSGRFELAVSLGDLPESTDVEALARFVQVVALGMSIEAQGGVAGDDLRRTVDIAMTAWPHGNSGQPSGGVPSLKPAPVLMPNRVSQSSTSTGRG